MVANGFFAEWFLRKGYFILQNGFSEKVSLWKFFSYLPDLAIINNPISFLLSMSTIF